MHWQLVFQEPRVSRAAGAELPESDVLVTFSGLNSASLNASVL
ncbi:hypothetical protein D047_0777 [Vibrio parahaemolyticus VPTS-2010_2]|nr:hypothetical protein D047_0777 [Vibrio parahaemolyticus VPTS-2010_2]